MPAVLEKVKELLQSCSADSGDCDHCPVMEPCRQLWDACIDGSTNGKNSRGDMLGAFGNLMAARDLATELKASPAGDTAQAESLVKAMLARCR